METGDIYLAKNIDGHNGNRPILITSVNKDDCDAIVLTCKQPKDAEEVFVKFYIPHPLYLTNCTVNVFPEDLISQISTLAEEKFEMDELTRKRLKKSKKETDLILNNLFNI